MNEDPASSERMVAWAVERGINYFDVAPSYGNAQDRLGPALRPYRSKVFLACKTGKRSAAEAEAELEQSLRLMHTDHFDLYQLHAVTTGEDVQQILAPGGALETFVKARDRGLVRYLGFSAHSEEAFFELAKAYDFDSVLFPLNWVCWYRGGFGPRVVEAARERGMAILALKALARRKWRENETRTWSKAWYAPAETEEEARLAVRFTLSLPVTAATSPGHEELLRWACDAADDFTPVTEDEKHTLERRSADLDPLFSAAETRWKEAARTP
jgi:predicted aldo/keto reductase-like oxidoreductase